MTCYSLFRSRPSWRWLSPLALTFALALALCTTHPASAADGEDQLLLQSRQDMTLPFTQTHWVGTHNSYNAYNWGYHYDPNQELTLGKQLEAGVRELVFDVHWYSSQMILCHAGSDHVGCTGSDNKFREGLDKIRNWLNNGHRDEVILLKLELAISGHKSKLKNQLEAELGGYLFRPDNDGVYLNPGNGKAEGCMGFPVRMVTKEDVLAAGKNVIVLQTDDDKNCTGNYGLDSAIYSGFWLGDHHVTHYTPSEIANLYVDKFEKPSDSSDCLDNSETNQDVMVRQFDPNTWYRIAGEGDQKITAGNVEDYFACGLNVFELYNFNNPGEPTFGPGLRAEDLVWGWKPGEPSQSIWENCAFLDSDGLADLNCGNWNPYACRDDAGNWRVTTAASVWGEGSTACPQEFGDQFQFAAPQSYPEMQDLLDETTAPRTWVNYHDKSIEGYWQANLEPQTWTVTPLHGGIVGDNYFDTPFDDKDFLGLNRQWTTNLTEVFIRSGDRVSEVGFKYNNGTSVEHGGGSGSKSTLAISWNEYIDKATVCVDNDQGSDTIFYLKFTTNQGNSIQGGTYSGSCNNYFPYQKALVGVFGRTDMRSLHAGGYRVDGLGFYFRSWEDHWGWNHGEPNGGTSENCARFHGEIMTDKSCSDSYRFACKGATGNWVVAAQSGSWFGGEDACANEGAQYEFSAPRTRHEGDLLKAAMGGLSHVWIKYSDLVSEGTWRFGS